MSNDSPIELITADLKKILPKNLRDAVSYSASLILRVNALEKEEWTFLRKVLSQANFQVHEVYGSVKTATDAQGELLYFRTVAAIVKYHDYRAEAERLKAEHESMVQRITVENRWINQLSYDLQCMGLPPKRSGKVAAAVYLYYGSRDYAHIAPFEKDLLTKAEYRFTVKNGRVYFYGLRDKQPSYPVTVALKEMLERHCLGPR
jgi:hypothetical protein